VVRRLFLLQFRRSLTPFLLFVFATYGALYAFELWGVHSAKGDPAAAADIHRAVTLIILTIILGIAFPAGANAFPREFKDTHFLFLQSLPIRRQRAWAILVLANFSSFLLSSAIFFVLRPSLLEPMADPAASWTALEVCALIYFLLFCAGCCFSLLFARPIFYYLGAFLANGVVGTELVLMGLYLGSSESREVGISTFMAIGPLFDLPFLAVGLLLASLVYLLLSMWFYVLGEFNLIRTQIRNGAWITASLGALLALLALGVNAGVFSLFDTWEAEWWDRSNIVSADGKYAAVFETRASHPQFTRIHILDVMDGAIVGTVEKQGMAGARWVDESDVLHVIVREDSPLYRLGYVLPGSDQFLTISPQGREIQRKRFAFSRVQASRALAGGKTLLVVSGGDSGKILSMDNSTGETKELGSGYLDGGARIWHLTNGDLVWFRNYRAPSRAWLVGSEIHELNPGPSPKPDEGFVCIVDDFLFKTNESCLKEVSKLYPPPATAESGRKTSSQGWYLVPPPLIDDFMGVWPLSAYVDHTMAVFYVEQQPSAQEGRLFVFRGPDQGWRLVAQGIHLSMWDVHTDGIYTSGTALGADSTAGLAAYYIEKGDRVFAYLYDSKLDKTVDLGNLPKPDPVHEMHISMRRFPGMKSEAIFFHQTRSPKFEGLAFKYVPQSGSLTKLELAAMHGENTPNSMAHLDEEGNQIYALWYPYRLIFEGADHKQRQLWPPTSH